MWDDYFLEKTLKTVRWGFNTVKKLPQLNTVNFEGHCGEVTCESCFIQHKTQWQQMVLVNN